MTATPRELNDEEVDKLVDDLPRGVKVNDPPALRDSLRKAVDAYIGYRPDVDDTRESDNDLDQLEKSLFAGIKWLLDERNYVPLAQSLVGHDVDPGDERVGAASDRLDALAREMEAVRLAARDAQRRDRRPGWRPTKGDCDLKQLVKALRGIWELGTGRDFAWGWTTIDQKREPQRAVATSGAMKFVERVVEAVHPEELPHLRAVTKAVIYRK